MNSRYLKINDFILLEYTYSNELIDKNNTGCFKLFNKNDGSTLFFNDSLAFKSTKNTLLTNSTLINKFGNYYSNLQTELGGVRLDSVNSDIVITDIKSVLSSVNIGYDRVRIHIISGYQFPDNDGFVISFYIKDLSKNTIRLSNLYFEKSNNDLITYNDKPFLLLDGVYDRYIEFKIPSLFFIINEQNSAPNNLNNLGIQLSPNGSLIDVNTLIYADFYSINKTLIVNGFKNFILEDLKRLSFSGVDTFALLGARIEEMPDSDMFRFYATWNNDIINDYITNLNSVSNNSWGVIHQIDIISQVGSDFINESHFNVLQVSNFDEPIYYRPIIKNSEVAYSFSIDYTMRLFNKNDGQQVIRNASITSLNPKKYGLKTSRITIPSSNNIKVYNKIVDNNLSLSPLISNNNSSNDKVITVTKYVNNFINTLNVGVSGDGLFNNSIYKNIYPNGTGYILLSDFDNNISLILYVKDDVNDDSKNYKLMNIDDISLYSLSFILDDGTKIYISPSLEDSNINESKLFFKIKSDISKKVLNQRNKNWYLITKTKDGDSVLYFGKYDNIINKKSVELELTNIIKNEIQSTIKTLKDNINIIKDVNIKSNIKTPIKNINKIDTISIDKQNQSLIESIKNDKNNNISIKDIPGLFPNLGTNLNAIKPQNQ